MVSERQTNQSLFIVNYRFIVREIERFYFLFYGISEIQIMDF